MHKTMLFRLNQLTREVAIIMDGIYPHTQKSRRNLRRESRENKNILYTDSNDSENESKYSKTTKRSMLHTPTRKKRL